MKTVRELLEERGKTYGSFRNNARIAQRVKDLFRQERPYDELPDDVCETLDMIAAKLGRILSVEHGWRHEDNWADIAGYATLCRRFAESVKEEAESEQTSAPGYTPPARESFEP